MILPVIVSLRLKPRSHSQFFPFPYSPCPIGFHILMLLSLSRLLLVPLLFSQGYCSEAASCSRPSSVDEGFLAVPLLPHSFSLTHPLGSTQSKHTSRYTSPTETFRWPPLSRYKIHILLHSTHCLAGPDPCFSLQPGLSLVALQQILGISNLLVSP